MYEYWTVDEVVDTPLFRKYMTRQRFREILQFLHFEDNNNASNQDRLWKIRNIFIKFLAKFSKFFKPNQNFVINESLVLFKGRLVYKQYIPYKRRRFGIKLFILCDCATGIILDVIVYNGMDVGISKDDVLGLSGVIVKKFMASYLNKGHILYTDNWYTSPSLSMYLAQNNTGSCGTVEKSPKNFLRFEAVTQVRSTIKQNAIICLP